MGPIIDPETWWEYVPEETIQVCSGNGNSIFYEDDNLCHRRFAVSRQ